MKTSIPNVTKRRFKKPGGTLKRVIYGGSLSDDEAQSPVDAGRSRAANSRIESPPQSPVIQNEEIIDRQDEEPAANFKAAPDRPPMSNAPEIHLAPRSLTDPTHLTDLPVKEPAPIGVGAKFATGTEMKSVGSNQTIDSIVADDHVFAGSQFAPNTLSNVQVASYAPTSFMLRGGIPEYNIDSNGENDPLGGPTYMIENEFQGFYPSFN